MYNKLHLAVVVVAVVVVVLTSTRINIELFECVANLGKDGEVTGWKPSNRKYLRGLIYENNTGTFHIKLSGVYQV